MTEHRNRPWIEAALAVACAFLLILTIVWREWIEAVLRVDPDGYSGKAEWIVVATLATATVATALAARAEWWRVQPSRDA